MLVLVFDWFDSHCCLLESALKSEARNPKSGTNTKHEAQINYDNKVKAVDKAAALLLDNWASIFTTILKCEIPDTKLRHPSIKLLRTISGFSWLGKTNTRYLYKNLGFDLAKDDRYMRRLALLFGYSEDGEGVQQLCEEIGELV
jgi:hypothetical protein